MLHQILSLTRPLFVFDLETTGVDPQTSRIVEIGFQRWEAEGMTKEWRTLVNPSIPIPASATKVHGITDLDLKLCRECGFVKIHSPIGDLVEQSCRCEVYKPWPTFRQLAANLAGGFQNCDFAGKNVRFDLRLLAVEMKRAGIEWSYLGARIIDAERLEQLAIPRSLSHLHQKYVGHKHDGAHGALSDVRASATVIVRQLQEHQMLPRDLDLLHKTQWPGWIDSEGKFKFIDGVACCCFGKWKDRPMKDIEPSYWDWVLKSDFHADVKALASDAKLGKFPEER